MRTPSTHVVILGPALLAAALCGACGARPAPVYTPAPTSADALGPAVPPVYLHLVANEGTALERATDDGWATVCASPCDGYVPARGTYRVALPEEHSAPFTLPGSPGTSVTLSVDDEGTVRTRDSDRLRARRARDDAAAAAWPATGWFARHGLATAFFP